MNKNRIVTFADAIHDLRPDWSHTGIVNQLTILETSWPGTLAAFYVHAITVAANPAAETPGALNTTTPITQQPATRQTTIEPSCNICHQPRSTCQRKYDFETRHGIPDAHQFEKRGAA